MEISRIGGEIEVAVVDLAAQYTVHYTSGLYA